MKHLKYLFGISLNIFVFLMLEEGYLQAQGSFDQNSANKSRTTRIHFVSQRNLIIIPIFINHRGPYRFIFDSGVSIMIITNPDLPKDLGLRKAGKISIKGYGSGNPLVADVVNQLQLNLGRIQGLNFSAAVLPKESLNFSNYVGMAIDGIIGYDLLKDFVVKIDFGNQEISFADKMLKGIPHHFQSIPLEIIKGHALMKVNCEFPQTGSLPLKTGLMPLNTGSIPLNLVMDTGSGNTIFIDLSSDSTIQIPKSAIKANLGWAIDGPILGSIGRLKDINLNGIKFSNTICAFLKTNEDLNVEDSLAIEPQENGNGNGNIGNEILRRFVLIIDYRNHVLYIKKRAKINSPFEYDMSGIGFTAEGEDFHRYFISSIDKDSPGDKAGLKVGDQLLFIGSSYTEDISVTELDQIFKSGDGKKLFILYFRGGKIWPTSLRLQKRV